MLGDIHLIRAMLFILKIGDAIMLLGKTNSSSPQKYNAWKVCSLS